MITSKTVHIIFGFLILLSLVLRIWLGTVNRDSNDNHIEVMQRIRDQKPTDIHDCWQCYHAKLFHYTTLTIDQVRGTGSYNSLAITGQIINLFAGILTCYLIILFLSQLPIAKTAFFLTATLVLFTPKMLTITIQATNDTLVIFFSTLAFFALWITPKKETRLKYLLTAVAVLMGFFAALSKLSGVITLLLVLAYIWGEILLQLYYKKIHSLKPLFLALIVTVTVVPATYVIGPYQDHFANHDNPFAINAPRDSLPRFFAKTNTWQPGTLSIFDAFFTFKLKSMLQEPYMTNNNQPYAEHRTSFWSLHYGQAQSAHYAQWPKSWGNTAPYVLWITRVLLVLGLPIPLFICTGMGVTIKDILRSIRNKKKLTSSVKKVFALSAVILVYLALFRYKILYREYTTAKFIFAGPVFIFIVYFFSIGLDTLLKRKPALLKMITVWCVCITLFYILDLVVLGVDLTRLLKH